MLCDGDQLRLELIQRRLVVGERLGGCRTTCRPCRSRGTSPRRSGGCGCRPRRWPATLDLDLRRDIDLERSRLLHRLRLLGVPWGEPLPSRRGTGTFRESWRLGWQPEFAVDLVEASVYGTTVPAAATARVAEQARHGRRRWPR